MVCDDDLSGFVGATLVDVEIADAPNEEGESACDDVHEVQFLRVITSAGTIVVATHNGYYGGFAIVAREL